MSLTNSLRNTVAVLGWRFPLRRLMTVTSPTVLVYHGVPRNGLRFSADDFARQLDFLKANFDLISFGAIENRRSRSARIQVLLTFDDGFRNNAEVAAPLLRERGIPAIFFVCGPPPQRSCGLWFAYLQMLDRYFTGDVLTFRDETYDLTQDRRAASLAKLRARLLALRPHPSAMYEAMENELPAITGFTTAEQRADEWDVMSEDQIGELASDPLFTIGAHTVDHPFLTLCEFAEAQRQLAANKQWIETLTGRPCQVMAYPVSDYSAEVLRLTAEAGFNWGFSLAHKLPGDERMQVPRVGIYYPSLTELGFKVRWGNTLQTLQRRGWVPVGAA